MKQLHNYFCNKLGWYNQWHQSSWSLATHLAILVVFSAFLSVAISGSWASLKFLKINAALASQTVKSNSDTEYSSNQVLVRVKLSARNKVKEGNISTSGLSSLSEANKVKKVVSFKKLVKPNSKSNPNADVFGWYMITFDGPSTILKNNGIDKDESDPSFSDLKQIIGKLNKDSSIDQVSYNYVYRAIAPKRTPTPTPTPSETPTPTPTPTPSPSPTPTPTPIPTPTPNIPPNDPLWLQQWDMTKISAPLAWAVQNDASDVVVAVVDSGIDYNHPDLQSNLWSDTGGNHGFTCILGTCNFGGQDNYGHGTHIAGTIGAAANNLIGMAGINWNVKLMAVKFLDSYGNGMTSDAVLAFQKIADLKQSGVNIRVANNSWASPTHGQALRDAMSQVEDLGIINVAASGNNALNTDITPSYPASFDGRGIISVLATDANDAGAYFTNYGYATVDIAAPGMSTLSTVPTGTCYYCDPSGYSFLSGTSMAAPHVTGAVAALLHLYPGLSAEQVRDAVLHPQSYDTVSSLAALTSSGGRLNLNKLFTNSFNSNPVLNQFPVMLMPQYVIGNAGTQYTIFSDTIDQDGDLISKGTFKQSFGSQYVSTTDLLGWALRKAFPLPTGNYIYFTAPRLERPGLATYQISSRDGRGGGVIAQTQFNINPDVTLAGPPYGILTATSVSGTTYSINYPLTDPDSGLTAWGFVTAGIGIPDNAYFNCCYTGSSATYTFPSQGVFRVGADGIDTQLQQSERKSVIVRTGGAVGTPPIIGLNIDQSSGQAPLTVNVSATTQAFDGATVSTYIAGDYCSGYENVQCVYNKPGNYRIIARATDSNSLKDYVIRYITVLPPIPPLSASIVSPEENSVYKNDKTVTIYAYASSGTDKITKVELYKNGVYYDSRSYSSGYNKYEFSNFSWSITSADNGTNVWTVKAYDSAGNSTTSLPRSFVVDILIPIPVINLNPDSVIFTGMNNAPPPASQQVTLSNPGTGILNWTATANQPWCHVTPSSGSMNVGGSGQVYVSVDTMSLGIYSCSVSFVDPNASNSPQNIGVIYNVYADSIVPTSVITYPLNNTFVTGGSTVIISADASDNVGVTQVDFYVNNNFMCGDTTLPYTCAWRVPNAPNKTYKLQTKPHDAQGGIGNSAIVTVTSK